MIQSRISEAQRMFKTRPKPTAMAVGQIEFVTIAALDRDTARTHLITISKEDLSDKGRGDQYDDFRWHKRQRPHRARERRQHGDDDLYSRRASRWRRSRSSIRSSVAESFSKRLITRRRIRHCFQRISCDRDNRTSATCSISRRSVCATGVSRSRR